jgi:NADH-quinone oxidoreductase subunit N
MNLQNTDLLLFEYDIFNTFILEIFLAFCTFILLLWILIFQNRNDLAYLNLNDNIRWTTFLILTLSLFVCYFSNFVNFTWAPIHAVFTLGVFSYNARVLTLVVTLLFFLIISSFTKKHSVSGLNELCCIILISVISLVVLVGVNDFLCFFMCVELQGLGFYVLACFRKNSDFSIEAGVKYFITGAFATCLMLFGISLIYGITGTLNFIELKQVVFSLDFTSNLSNSNASMVYLSLHLGFLLLLVSLLFKLGLAPLHFWLPDVYEGSPTNVTAFFALVPKVAILIITVRLLLEVFYPFEYLWKPVLLQTAVISVFIGTLGALHQRRIKRLLAYSTIGHSGFLALALASANQESLNSLMVYILLYILTSSCLFLFILNVTQRGFLVENPTFYESFGIIKTNQILGFCLILPLFSLAGIPPLIGFVAKYQMLIASVQAGYFFVPLLLVIISVVACYYYIRLTKVNFFENTEFSWNCTISRQSSLCFSTFCGLIFFLSALPRFFTLLIL